MNTVLYFSPNDVVYETRAYTNADIAELVHDYGLESLTSADRQFEFPGSLRQLGGAAAKSTAAPPSCCWPRPSSPPKQCLRSAAQLWSPPTTQPATSMDSAGSS